MLVFLFHTGRVSTLTMFLFSRRRSTMSVLSGVSSVAPSGGLQVVSVLELTATGRKGETKGAADAALQARQHAFEEIKRACTW